MRVLNGEGNNSVEEEREEKKNSKRDKRNVQIKAYFSDSVLVLRNVRNARTPSVKSTSRDSLGVAHCRLSMDEQSVIRYSLRT